MSDIEAFEKWAADKRFLLEVNDRDGYVGCVNVEDVAWEAWQAALQHSGEPVAEIQEYKHWLFCDNGERDGFEWRKRQVNNGDLLSLPHGTKLYTASQPVVDADMLLNELSCLYWSAYNKGHNDTVEACYADVHTTDRFYYWMDQVKEIASEGDVPVVNALLRATVKDSLTAAPQPVVPEDTLRAAFIAGFRYCAVKWAGRDDLYSDVHSEKFCKGMANALKALQSAGKGGEHD
jgi:hypothetical protein